MLHISKRYFSFGKQIIARNIKDAKMKKIVDNFFKQNDKKGEIRESLKIGQELVPHDVPDDKTCKQKGNKELF